jgi:hypothetical protein
MSRNPARWRRASLTGFLGEDPGLDGPDPGDFGRDKHVQKGGADALDVQVDADGVLDHSGTGRAEVELIAIQPGSMLPGPSAADIRT